MIGALIGPLTSLVGSWMDSKAEQQRAKQTVARVKAESEAAVMVSAATSTADWEKLMAEGSKSSLKDEFFSVILAAPCILAFCGEWGRTIVAEGFVALEAMPEYYRYFLGCAIAASFSIRGATKFMSRPK